MIEVFIREEGPREGVQSHQGTVSLKDKAKLIELLVASGLHSVQVCSWVRPDKVPQMADSEQLVKMLPKTKSTTFTSLFLNEKGFEIASSFPNLENEGCLLISAHDDFLKSNSNTTFSEELEKFKNWKQIFSKHNQRFHRLMVSTAFGSHKTGVQNGSEAMAALEKTLERLDELEFLPQEVTFADTAGFAVPLAVTRICKEFREKFSFLELGFHFHDTKGMGIANTLVALAEGVRSFDSSIAGVGGCPFVPGAAGNIATEELVYLCETEGLRTGVNLEALIEAGRFASKIFNQTSKLLRFYS